MAHSEWVTFHGGELQALAGGVSPRSTSRPRAVCARCRARGDRPKDGAACFACYRAELERLRTMARAGQIEAASDERWQFLLPFDPVDRPRLTMLRAERLVAGGVRHDTFEERRRAAQRSARHALQSSDVGFGPAARAERAAALAAAIQAAELQLPESWWPFVIAS